MARAPWLHVEVSMDAIFSGASRAFLTSVVFAFETTQQPHALLPLLGACTAAYTVSGLMMRNPIMTDKIVRGGVRVPAEYSADCLDQVLVRNACSRDVISLQAKEPLIESSRIAFESSKTSIQGARRRARVIPESSLAAP